MTALPQKPFRPRIAILSGYMTYYEPHMPEGFRAARAAWGQDIAALLAGIGEARFFGLMTDLETGRRIGADLSAWAPDVLVLAPAMPGPPAFTWEAIAGLPRVPVVLWAAGHLDGLAPDYDSIDHLANSGAVGVAMIGNMLARHGRAPTVLAGRWTDAAARRDLCAAVRRAAVAGRLARARVGVLGRPLDGYSNVVVDAGLLRDRLGAELVEVPLAEWEETFAAVDPAAVDGVRDWLVAHCRVEAPDGEDLLASCRLAAALAAVAARHGLDCGTFNSHLEYSHANPAIGLVGGLATSWLTSTGIPFTDTGDTVTAIAMLAARLLTGTSVYTELNLIDYAADAVLCANTGEADFAAAGTVRVAPARSSTGKVQRGAIVDAEFVPGPATIVGFTPVPEGLRFIAMPGELLGRPELDLHVPHTLFRPASGSAAAGFARWIEAGATHHAAIARGDAAADIAGIARLLNLDVRIVP